MYIRHCIAALEVIVAQWCSQDEQVTWAQHGHIQCVHNTHLLEELGHAPAMKIFGNYTL